MRISGKTLIFLVCCLFTSLSGKAQFSIGAYAGTNLALVTGDSISPFLYTVVQPKFGVNAEIGLSRLFALQPEVGILGQGYRELVQSPEGEAEIRLHLTQLGINLLAKARLVGCNRWNAFLIAGPSIWYALEGTIDYKGESAKIDFNELDRFRRTTWGVGAGAGFTFSVTNFIRLFFDIRHEWGLVDITTNGSREKINNTGFEVGALFTLAGNSNR